MLRHVPTTSGRWISAIAGGCVLLGMVVVSIGLQSRKSELVEQVADASHQIEILQAELLGVRQANGQLHQRITYLQAELEKSSAERETTSETDMRADSDFFPFPEPPPEPGLPPQAPPAGPSPEVLEMMAQFPDHDFSQTPPGPNVIEEYLQKKGQGTPPESSPPGSFGPGIDAVLEQQALEP